MVVKIVKCRGYHYYDRLWYHDKIGMSYKVVERDGFLCNNKYFLADSSNKVLIEGGHALAIYKSDCNIISD